MGAHIFPLTQTPGQNPVSRWSTIVEYRLPSFLRTWPQPPRCLPLWLNNLTLKSDLCCWYVKWIFQLLSHAFTELPIDQKRNSPARVFPTQCLGKQNYMVHEKSAIGIWQPWELLRDLKTQVQHFHISLFFSFQTVFWPYSFDPLPARGQKEENCWQAANPSQGCDIARSTYSIFWKFWKLMS